MHIPGSVDHLIVDFAAHVRKCKTGVVPVLHKPFGEARTPERPPAPPKPQKTPEALAAEQQIKREDRNTRRDIRAELAKELDGKRVKARKKLADDLRQTRKILAHLKYKRDHLAIELKQAFDNKVAEARASCASSILSARARVRDINASVEKISALKFPPISVRGSHDYPEIPPPFIEPSKLGNGLPEVPGIYFLWLNGVVDYVGKSTRLASRVRLGVHHVLKVDHRISFLPIDERELTWVECYYIGVARPRQNFGRAASHYKEITPPYAPTMEKTL